MKFFYLLFAGLIFGAFCFFQYRGTAFDTNQRIASPQYFNYRGYSSSSGSGRSGGGGVFFFSHK